MLVILQEDLKSKPDRVMQELFQFIGVDAGFQPDTSVNYNASRWPRFKTLHHLLHQIDRQTGVRATAGRILPSGLRQMVADVYKRVHYSTVPKMSEEVRELLVLSLREDVLQTQELIGRDLSTWAIPAASRRRGIAARREMMNSLKPSSPCVAVRRAAGRRPGPLIVSDRTKIALPVYSPPSIIFADKS